MMTELELLHEVKVSLLMCPDGAQGSSAVRLVAVAERTGTTPGALPRSVSRSHNVPAGVHGTMAPKVYQLLTELDWDCSKMWEQLRLPDA